MSATYRIFEAFGIELEYMIVDSKTLRVSPIADKLIKKACGSYEEEIERGTINWSNELALHVLELKTNGPAKDLGAAANAFHVQIQEINGMLKEWNSMLMPTAMHPFMNPDQDLKLWPHGRSEVYEAFNRVFNCKGHGWSNLQSMHINLPFGDDVEFEKLHAAIRIILPILPGLAAASPAMDGKLTGLCDNRLKVYEGNQKKVPSIAGEVIPEQVWSQRQYDREIFQRIYRDIAPFDPEMILQNEWLNSRGAIARFDRNAIEIRVIDVQECSAADIGIAMAVIAALKELVSEKHASLAKQKAWTATSLKSIFDDAVKSGSRCIIENADYLAMFGFNRAKASVGELWNQIVETSFAKSFPSPPKSATQALATILKHGTLSERITDAAPHGSIVEITDVYRQLSRCLQNGRSFLPT